MKTLVMTTVAASLLATTAYANNGQIRQLRDRIEQVNDEDQRLVDGNFNADTGRLTLYTEDMRPGDDGDISRRPVVVDGFDELRGQDGADGRDGVDGQNGSDGADGADGQDGADGRDGEDGRDGQDGQSVNLDHYLSDLATVTGIGGLEMRSPYENGFVWSMGIAGIDSEVGGALALSAGIGYGITENMSIYGKISVGEHSTAAFIGLEGRF